MKKLADTFQALGDINRLKVISALMLNHELRPCEISASLNLTPLDISRHLKTLIDTGLVNDRQEGKTIWYRLNKDSSDYEPIWEMIKYRMDNDMEFQTELNKIDEILIRDHEEIC